MSKTQHNDTSVGAVILASGFSSRMKQQKPFLRFDDNTFFINKIIENFIEFGCDRIVITINEEVSQWNEFISQFDNNPSIQFVPNKHPEYERFYSIKTGLEYIGNPDYCFIQNVDNPFIDYDILKIIYLSRTDSGYTVPIYEGKGGHPVLLSKCVNQQIKDENNIHLNLKEFLTRYERINAEVNSGKIHVNINTQEEYDKIFSSNKQLS